MKRCVRCGRAVSEDSGKYRCPWCAGALKDAGKPRSLEDALEMLWSCNPAWPYEPKVAALRDLAPDLKDAAFDVELAARYGVVGLIAQGNYGLARTELTGRLHWSCDYAESFLEAYARIDPARGTDIGSGGRAYDTTGSTGFGRGTSSIGGGRVHEQFSRNTGNRSNAIASNSGNYDQFLGDTPELDMDLFERLRVLRKELADEAGLAPYMVFPDRTLREMVQRRPKDELELLDVPGVGIVKLERYGQAFLDVLNSIF